MFTSPPPRFLKLILPRDLRKTDTGGCGGLRAEHGAEVDAVVAVLVVDPVHRHRQVGEVTGLGEQRDGGAVQGDQAVELDCDLERRTQGLVAPQIHEDA